MKKRKKTIPELKHTAVSGMLVILLFALTGLLIPAIFEQPENYKGSEKGIPENMKSGENEKGEEGPLFDIEFFKQWNYPYGMSFPKEVFERMWNEAQSLPSENSIDAQIVNSWRCIGPYGMTNNNSAARYTGRILDVEVNIPNNPLVATASGGLWGFFGFLPIPLSDDINCLAVGSFDIQPNNVNTILLGTGEYYTGTPNYQKSGTGLYKSTNSGNNWTHITMSPEPSGFSRIRYSTANPNIVHAATVNGYYRSTNGGSNWTRVLSSSFCYDIAIKPSNNNIIYLSREGALLKSTNGGLNFSVISSPGFPASDVSRISVTVGTSNSSIVYASVSKSSDDHLLGIYKSTDEGASWTNVSPADNIFGNQGWYNNVIGVSPSNTNIVLAGGVRLWRTTNGGLNWVQISDDDVHADQHAIVWKDGNTVYIGNDGGLAYSTDAGVNWISPSNSFPVTQYITLSTGVNNRGIIYGGSRDNGISGTTNGGQSWKQTKAGDGGGVYIDPTNAHNIYITNGAYNGNWSFQRFKSNDYGITWSDLNNSDIEPSNQFYTKMRGDKNSPARIYTNSGPYVYYSTNLGVNWLKLNAFPFTSSTLINFNVSKYSNTTGAAVYACLNSSPPSATQKLKVYDNGSWSERSGGMPSSQNVRFVAVHPTNTNYAYALINGVGTAGQKIYKTTNRGSNWTNISGNIPDVPMADLVPHPTDNNKLYLGTQLGCYKTTNGGQNWFRWNNGIPEATVITEMSYIDSISSNGRFYVVIGTYGRSIYIREISGDDPIGITQNSETVPAGFSLAQNYPNPFNPVTNIKFDVAKRGHIKLLVYDVNGRTVSVLVNSVLTPGSYTYDFDGTGLASGVYFYRYEAEAFSDVKKMMLVK